MVSIALSTDLTHTLVTIEVEGENRLYHTLYGHYEVRLCAMPPVACIQARVFVLTLNSYSYTRNYATWMRVCHRCQGRNVTRWYQRHSKSHRIKYWTNTIFLLPFPSMFSCLRMIEQRFRSKGDQYLRRNNLIIMCNDFVQARERNAVWCVVLH